MNYKNITSCNSMFNSSLVCQSFFLGLLSTLELLFSVFDEGTWQILEPIMSVEVAAPDEFQGAVMTQLNKRHGIITGSEGTAGWFTVFAEVPLNNMFGYAGDLRSSTEGKGEFSMEYSRYAPCLPEVQETVVQEYEKRMGIVPEKDKKKRNI